VYYSCDAAGDFNDEECLCHALQADGQMHVYRLKLSNVGGVRFGASASTLSIMLPAASPYRFILGDIAFAHVEGDKTGVERKPNRPRPRGYSGPPRFEVLPSAVAPDQPPARLRPG
jgi:hypothetical protein